MAAAHQTRLDLFNPLYNQKVTGQQSRMGGPQASCTSLHQPGAGGLSQQTFLWGLHTHIFPCINMCVLDNVNTGTDAITALRFKEKTFDIVTHPL